MVARIGRQIVICFPSNHTCFYSRKQAFWEKCSNEHFYSTAPPWLYDQWVNNKCRSTVEHISAWKVDIICHYTRLGVIKCWGSTSGSFLQWERIKRRVFQQAEKIKNPFQPFIPPTRLILLDPACFFDQLVKTQAESVQGKSAKLTGAD